MYIYIYGVPNVIFTCYSVITYLIKFNKYDFNISFRFESIFLDQKYPLTDFHYIG